MSKVKKHCNILNYVKYENKSLYELIQDLCLGNVFSVKRTGGLTFLNPSPQLTKQILKEANGENPDAAISMIRSLIIMEYVSDLSDFNKSNDMATHLAKALPDCKVDKNKVVFANGSVVEQSNFKMRQDRIPIQVFNLSKELIPSDGEKRQIKMKSKTVKGGGSFSGGRVGVFELLVKQHFEKQGNNPIAEFLVALIYHMENIDKSKYKAIVSQFSTDVLATLAIVLQPYYKGEIKYVSDVEFKQFSNIYDTKNNAQLASVWCELKENPVDVYRNEMKKNASSTVLNNIKQEINTNIGDFNKLNVNDILEKMVTNVMKKENIGGRNDVKLAMRESELRLVLKTYRENERLDMESCLILFKHKCDLNERYLMLKKADLVDCDLAHYYSVHLLLLHSDALFYIPSNEKRVGVSMNGDSITNPNELVLLCNTLVLYHCNEYYDNNQSKVDELRQLINKNKVLKA